MGCSEKKLDPALCNQLRSGTFQMYDAASHTSFQITRRNDIQTEINLSNNDTVTYRVVWGNECYYQLYLIKGPEWMLPAWEDNELTVKITDVGPDEFSYRAKFRKSEDIFTNKMTIVR